MNKKVFLGFALLLPACSFANIVQNGDFEVADGTVDASVAPGYVTVSNGDTASIPGWIEGLRQGDVSVDVVSQTGFGYVAASGDQFVDLAGTPGPGSIAQFLHTTPGQQYQLTFSASSNGGPQPMDIYWGNNATPFDVILGAPLNSWDVHTYTLTATNESTLLMFGCDNGGNAGSMVDAVSVTAVPEPCTLAILGLGGLALLRRRK